MDRKGIFLSYAHGGRHFCSAIRSRTGLGIYFDFNPPILTNTALTWIENTGSTAIGDPAESLPTFLQYPNPVKTGSLVRFSSALPASERWQMFGTDGVLVAEGRVAAGISAPAPGVYRVVCRNLAQSLVVVR